MTNVGKSNRELETAIITNRQRDSIDKVEEASHRIKMEWRNERNEL